MEQIEKLLEMWKVDAEIDKANISEEIIKIPRLHGKYLDILSRYKILLKEIDFKYLKMKRIMFEYYTGKMDQETLEKYNLEPFEYILKSDISLYMDSDERLNKYKVKKAIYEEVVSICNAILKELNSRTFQLKAYIDYEKFINGLN